MLAASAVVYPRSGPHDYDVPPAFPRALKAGKAARPRPRASDAELVRAVERVWRPLFARAGAEYEPARVAHFADPGADPCAPPEETLLGLYCDGGTIYLAERSSPDWPYVVAHEVGHHVQALRGTLSESGDDAEDHPARIVDVHLREELQADCYAGVWAHAARVPPPSPLFHDQPESEPGNPLQRRRWLMRGLRTGRPAACDTFAVRTP